MAQTTQTPKKGGYLALVKHLRDEAGYTGSLKIEDVEKFVADNGLTLDISGAKDLRDLHAKTVRISIEATGGEEVVVENNDEKAEDEPEPEMDEGKQAPAPRRKAVSEMVRSARTTTHGTIERKQYQSRIKTGKARFDDVDRAEAFGAWMRKRVAAVNKIDWYPQLDNDNAILGKGMSTTVNTAGGALVPDDFVPDLIALVDEYGAGRQAIGVTPMSRDTLTLSRLDDDFEPTWTGEAVEGSEDQPDVGNIELVARKLMGIARVTNELLNDAAISVADLLAESMARGTARKEDLAIFTGDGTSAYGGCVGFANAIGSAGVIEASGNLFSEFADADIQAALGTLPGYVHARGKIEIVCHSAVFFQVFNRLAFSKGGITYEVGQSGKPVYRYNGYPVRFAQVLPGTNANSQKCIYIGDFGMAAKFGQVKAFEIAASEHRNFDTDEMAFRCAERVALNVHDAGSTTAAGPVVAIASAGS